MIDDDGWRRLNTSTQSAAELTTRYEVLRQRAIERYADVVRPGMALLLRQGVAAWMQVSCEVAATPAPDIDPAPGAGTRSCLPSNAVTVEVVHVLAAMALQHIEEAHV